jgi:hypothetical protein
MKKVLFIVFLAISCFAIETQAQTAAAEKPATAVVDTMVLKAYVGSYKSDLGQIKVWLEDAKLIGEMEGQGKGELRLTDKEDILTVEGMDASVTFIRNDDKKVIKLKINAQGNVIEGDKVE